VPFQVVTLLELTATGSTGILLPEDVKRNFYWLDSIEKKISRKYEDPQFLKQLIKGYER